MIFYDDSKQAVLLSSVSCWCTPCRKGKFLLCQKFSASTKQVIPNHVLERLYEPKTEKSSQSQQPPAPTQNELYSPFSLVENTLDNIYSQPSVFDEAEILDEPSSSDNSQFLLISTVTFSKRKVPDKYAHFLSPSLGTECDNFSIDDVASLLRPQFLSRSKLLLGCIDISIIASHAEKRNLLSEGRVSDECAKISKIIFKLAEKKTNIETIDFVILSTTDMAKNDSLVMTGEQSTGHFLFCSLNLENATLSIFDTLGISDLSEHPFVSEKALKKLSNTILVSITHHRRVKLVFKQTKFVQTGNVCGYLALLHCFLVLKYDYDAITDYNFRNFISSIELLKRFLLFQLIKKKVALDKLTLS